MAGIYIANPPRRNLIVKDNKLNDKSNKIYTQFANEFADEFEDDEAEGGKHKKGLSELDQLLEESFKAPSKKLAVGDRVKGELVAVGDSEVFFSIKIKDGQQNLATPRDGSVPKKELINSEGVLSYKVGDHIDLYVTKTKGSIITLSPSPTAKNIAADLKDAYGSSLPIEGRVTEACNGGVRVTIRGKSAFCPIGQLDLARVESVDNYIGQKFDFLIIEYAENGRNIVVSRRKLLQNQRSLSEKSFFKDHHEGQVVPGIVRRIENFGAFVEIAPGIEGLLHISELSWSRVNDTHEVLTVGQEVQVKILKIEKDAKNKGSDKGKEGRTKISLSIKQATAEPWSNVSQNFTEGTTVNGKVTRCTKFGAFVEITPGVEGLIPLSEMSYTKRVVRSDELFKEGDRITVMIKEIHPDTRRISLSYKDAGEDPWTLVPEKFPIGKVVSGKVNRRETYGVFVELEEGITGLLPKSRAASNPEFPYDKLKLGDTTTVQIDELDIEGRRISLGVPPDPNQDDWKNYINSSNNNKHPAGEAHSSNNNGDKKLDIKNNLADKLKNFVVKKS